MDEPLAFLPEGEALQRIRRAKADNLWGLDVRELGLRLLPLEVGQLGALGMLVASYNSLEELPDKLADCQSLEEIYASYNLLTSLPPNFGRLLGLTVLHLNGNKFEEFPTCLFVLPRLSTLFLDNNKLSTVPSGISTLTSLEILDLHANRLDSLPPEIGKLSHLQRLSVGHNRLKTLPREVAGLLRLEALNIVYNRFQALPVETASLPRLVRIRAEGNPFLLVECTHTTFPDGQLPADMGTEVVVRDENGENVEGGEGESRREEGEEQGEGEEERTLASVFPNYHFRTAENTLQELCCSVMVESANVKCRQGDSVEAKTREVVSKALNPNLQSPNSQNETGGWKSMGKAVFEVENVGSDGGNVLPGELQRWVEERVWPCCVCRRLACFDALLPKNFFPSDLHSRANITKPLIGRLCQWCCQSATKRTQSET
eukprot:comp23694_c1_seq1/m.40689 comp23694_c1_seq1/g.40689  ORF comp23694_c1_seq1/g.40689 comp23694_c1_seq1/m.40689 type:complete len:431 (-) comp23694_c1_seq1:189-1481(-)